MLTDSRSRVSPHELRIPELDALRGLAVLAVLLFHYTSRFDSIYGYSEAPVLTFPDGSFGVEFFFAISGFVIIWTTSRTRHVRDFFVSRFSRLWPAYAVGVALTWTIVALFGLPGREFGPLPALFNLTMLQELLGIPHIDGAYWSLYVELIFYGWTALALTFGVLKHRIAIVYVGLLVAITLQAIQDAFSFAIPGRALKLALAQFLPFFAIGILVFDAREKGRIGWQHMAPVVASICVAGYANHRIAFAVVAAFAFLSIAGVAFGMMRFLAIRPLLFLGSISYSLYLVHQNIGYVVIRQALANGWTTEMAIAGATATCIAIATLLRLLVEAPAQRAIRSWNSARTTRVTTAAG